MEKQLVLVTGASSGIGLSLAKELEDRNRSVGGITNATNYPQARNRVLAVSVSR